MAFKKVELKLIIVYDDTNDDANQRVERVKKEINSSKYQREFLELSKGFKNVKATFKENK
jgi:hypothetical protein